MSNKRQRQLLIFHHFKFIERNQGSASINREIRSRGRVKDGESGFNGIKRDVEFIGQVRLVTNTMWFWKDSTALFVRLCVCKRLPFKGWHSMIVSVPCVHTCSTCITCITCTCCWSVRQFVVHTHSKYMTCTREQVFIGKQKDDLDGVAVPTPYIQQYFYSITETRMTQMWAFESA